MKLLHLGTVLSAAVFSFMHCFHAANAQDPDYACFMTTESGQVIDLSKSVCGSNKKYVPAANANSDSANSNQAVSEKSKRKLSEEKALRQEALRIIQAKKEKVSGSSTAYTENVPDPSVTYIPR